MNDDLSGFNDWTEVFAEWNDVSISELHGIMSAIMTGCHAPNGEGWQLLFEELSFAPLDDEALQLFTEYAEDTSHLLADSEDAYEFAPLVPDDEHELNERLFALKDWAGGFLTGLGVVELNFSKEEGELLADLAKVASMPVVINEAMAEDEEVITEPVPAEDEDDIKAAAEEQYLQLYEFVRMLPISLNRKNRKNIKELAIIKGLSPERLTAQEAKNREVKDKETKSLPPVLNAMNAKKS